MSLDPPPSPPPPSALVEAAQQNLLDRVQELLPSTPPPERRQALHAACQHGHADCVRILLLNQDSETSITKENDDHTNLLLHATVTSPLTGADDKYAVCQVLLEHGADPAAVDSHGHVPLDYCLRLASGVPEGHGLLRALQPPEPAILQAVDNCDLPRLVQILQADPTAANATDRGESPLVRACVAMALLLDPDVVNTPSNEDDDDDDKTNLADWQDIVQALLDAGAAVNPTLPDDDDDDSPPPSPFYILLEAMRDRIVAPTKSSTNADSEVEVEDPALHVARLLYQKGATLNPPQHASLWHQAAVQGHVSVLQYLHQHFSNLFDINVAVTTAKGPSNNSNSSTLLHVAAAAGQIAVVQWTLQQPGINLEALDEAGQTAQQVAVSKEHEAIGHLLDAYSKVIS